MKKLVFILRFINIFIFVFLLAIFFIYRHVSSFSKNYIFKKIENINTAQAVIILGARVYKSGALCSMLEDRVKSGFELYKAKKVKKILISGDHGQKNYDEVNTIKKHLLEMGVPGEDIFLDHAGFDTYDSLYRAQYIFEIKKAVVVTQNFHLPRAVYIGKSLNIDICGYIADKRKYSTGLYSSLREIPARLKAFLEVNLKVKPKYLGSKIPITGDSNKSWD